MPEVSSVPSNLYGESHLSASAATSERDEHEPLTDVLLLIKTLRTIPQHPAVKVLSGSEHILRRPAGHGNFGKLRMISVVELMATLKNGTRYAFKLKKTGDKRVLWVREIRYRRNEIAAWSRCYRTVHASVLPPSPEWLRSMNRNNDTLASSMIWGKAERRADANGGFSIRTLGGN